MHQCLQHAEFLLVASRQRADAPVELRAQALGQFMHVRHVRNAAHRAEIPQQLSPRQIVVHAQFAGQKAGTGTNGLRLTANVHAEDGCRTARRPDEVEEQADSGRFPCAVGADKAVDFAAAHVEIKVHHAATLAVVLG